jgi:RHS repeat-associated protein
MTDAVAGQVEYTDYLPFGGQRDHTGTTFASYRYTDQELDPSTGLYNYDARLYDPMIGRFVSADSIVPDLYDPQLLNRYAYVKNNPLKYIDPDGHEPVTLTIAAATAIAAGAVAVTYGIFHYGKDVAADFGKWLGQKIFHKAETEGTDDKPRSNPLTGKPGATGKIDGKKGKPKQDRYYGPDGYPEKDIDYDHDHDQGQPHAHDWGRPEEGGRPTHKDRQKGRPLTKEEEASSRTVQPGQGEADQTRNGVSANDRASELGEEE